MGVVAAEVTFGGGVAEADAGGVFLLELLIELRTFEKLFCTTSFLRSPLILQNSLTNFIILHFISGLD